MTLAYQRAQVGLRALTYRDVTRLWKLLDPARLDATFPVFAAALFALLQERRAVSVALGRAYLAEMRAGVPGEVPPSEPDDLPTRVVLTALFFASVVSVKKAMARGTPLEAALRNSLVRTMGVVDEHVNDGARTTIRNSLQHDPYARGYIRRSLTAGCDWCDTLADRRSKTGEVFPRHPHCVTPETVVAGPSVEIAYRRWYEGELLIIGLAGGEELSITPNHPVLTGRGWVEPALLREGDEVAQRAGADAASLDVPYEDQVPSRIQDVWRANRVNGFGSVPLSPQDFHGDGDGTKRDVEVVATNGFLARMLDSGHRQLFREPIGAGTTARTSVPLSCDGDSLSVFLGDRLSSAGCVGGSSSARAFLGGERSLVEERRFARLADVNPVFYEPPSYNETTDPEPTRQRSLGLTGNVAGNELGFGQLDAIGGRPARARPRFDPPPTQRKSQRLAVHAQLGGDLLERLSGGVQLSRVSDLRRVDYSGHVYNLQTAEGWYDASGVIVSNCGCVPEPQYS